MEGLVLIQFTIALWYPRERIAQMLQEDGVLGIYPLRIRGLADYVLVTTSEQPAQEWFRYIEAKYKGDGITFQLLGKRETWQDR